MQTPSQVLDYCQVYKTCSFIKYKTKNVKCGWVFKQCQGHCLNSLMASCKKERPTIQQKEKLKNKHQNPLLGGASNGKYWFSPSTL